MKMQLQSVCVMLFKLLLDAYKDKLLYVGGMLDKENKSTIIWNDLKEIRKTEKIKGFWDTEDPGLDCVFIRWNGVGALNYLTGHCNTPAYYLCETIRGNIIPLGNDLLKQVKRLKLVKNKFVFCVLLLTVLQSICAEKSICLKMSLLRYTV